jgi:hypothetical protein
MGRCSGSSLRMRSSTRSVSQSTSRSEDSPIFSGSSAPISTRSAASASFHGTLPRLLPILRASSGLASISLPRRKLSVSDGSKGPSSTCRAASPTNVSKPSSFCLRSKRPASTIRSDGHGGRPSDPLHRPMTVRSRLNTAAPPRSASSMVSKITSTGFCPWLSFSACTNTSSTFSSSSWPVLSSTRSGRRAPGEPAPPSSSRPSASTRPRAPPSSCRSSCAAKRRTSRHAALVTSKASSSSKSILAQGIPRGTQ